MYMANIISGEYSINKFVIVVVAVVVGFTFKITYYSSIKKTRKNKKKKPKPKPKPIEIKK